MSVTDFPSGYFEVLPPPEVSVIDPVGENANMFAFHATTRSTARWAAELGADPLYVPRTATPIVPELKPEACAPVIALSMLPARPS